MVLFTKMTWVIFLEITREKDGFWDKRKKNVADAPMGVAQRPDAAAAAARFTNLRNDRRDMLRNIEKRLFDPGWEMGNTIGADTCTNALAMAHAAAFRQHKGAVQQTICL